MKTRSAGEACAGAAGPHRLRLARACCKAVAGGGAGQLPAARGKGRVGEVEARGLCRVRPEVGVGEGQRVPVAREELAHCRRGRAPGGAAMGAGARLPVGSVDVYSG